MAGRSNHSRKETVYVSSTFVDLERHRAELKTALERAQYDVECMEKYPAFDERPVDSAFPDGVVFLDLYALQAQPEQVWDRLASRLHGHPLALHWAGNLLARDDDDPALLIGDWERGALPSLSDPVQAGTEPVWVGPAT